MAWQHQRPWHVLQTGFDLGLQFLTTWRDWQQSPARPDRLFFTVITEQALPSHEALTGLAVRPEMQAMQRQLATAWRGMTPGTHRLVFADGHVLLTLHAGPTDKLLRELDVAADHVVLDAGFFAATSPAALTNAPNNANAPCTSPLQRLQTLSRVCRPGTRVTMALSPSDPYTPPGPQQNPSQNAAQPSPEAWQQCGFILYPTTIPTTTSAWPPTQGPAQAETLPPGVTATFAPTWTPRSRLRQNLPAVSRQVLVIGAGLSGSAVAHSLAVRGWAVTVLDQGDAPGAGASGLPAGLAAPHVSPDDSVLSRITRAGVRATLQRAQTLLHSGTDWAPTGVLEHRVEGKRSLPTGDAWPASGHEWSTQATAAHIAAAGLPLSRPRCGTGWRAGSGRVSWRRRSCKHRA